MEREECGNCDGTGASDCPIDWDGACPPQCHVCGGDQLVRCPVCDGSGYEEEY